MYSTLSNVATAQSGIVNKSMVVEFIKAIWGVKSLLYRRAAIRMLRNSDRSVLSEATKSSRALDLIQSWIISCISDQDAGVENAGAFLVEVIKVRERFFLIL